MRAKPNLSIKTVAAIRYNVSAVELLDATTTSFGYRLSAAAAGDTYSLSDVIAANARI